MIGVGVVGREAYLAGNWDDMPNNARALTRAARERARATGETYTQAREATLRIRERMAEAEETFEEASAWYDDPANQLLCQTCGWTVGMVCPECSPGCGCVSSCSGWRHREYAHDDDPYRMFPGHATVGSDPGPRTFAHTQVTSSAVGVNAFASSRAETMDGNRGYAVRSTKAI